MRCRLLSVLNSCNSKLPSTQFSSLFNRSYCNNASKFSTQYSRTKYQRAPSLQLPFISLQIKDKFYSPISSIFKGVFVYFLRAQKTTIKKIPPLHNQENVAIVAASASSFPLQFLSTDSFPLNHIHVCGFSHNVSINFYASRNIDTVLWHFSHTSCWIYRIMHVCSRIYIYFLAVYYVACYRFYVLYEHRWRMLEEYSRFFFSPFSYGCSLNFLFLLVE